MIYLQTIIPIPIHTVPSKPLTEDEGKFFLALLLILLGMTVISLLYELYKQWRDGRLIDWEELLLTDTMVQAFLHVGMIVMMGIILLIWLATKLMQYL